jgi:hypothetical protein
MSNQTWALTKCLHPWTTDSMKLRSSLCNHSRGCSVSWQPSVPWHTSAKLFISSFNGQVYKLGYRLHNFKIYYSVNNFNSVNKSCSVGLNWPYVTIWFRFPTDTEHNFFCKFTFSIFILSIMQRRPQPYIKVSGQLHIHIQGKNL